MKIVPEFLIEATNVYRTKNFIVRQIISIEKTCSGGKELFSVDTFFKRTKFRDKQFEFVFADRTNIDGRRLPTTAYSKNYVD